MGGSETGVPRGSGALLAMTSPLQEKTVLNR